MSDLQDYMRFLDRKTQTGADSGFAPTFMPSFLFDFQQEMVDWAVRKDRAAIFADCGLGKTPMGLTWASNVARKTKKPTLYLTPLQLDVIDRCVELFSNKGENVFTPFMGVGSEVYSPVILGRRGIGAELKPSYYRQAVKNVQMAAAGRKDLETSEALDFGEMETEDA